MVASDNMNGGQNTKERNSLISIVDDDVSAREGLAGLLKWLGLEVQQFSSAVEFLDSPKIEDSSCVIADVQMPIMTGMELHARLMELGYKIPTILVTAYPSEGAEANALASGVICYLTKPYNKDTIIGCVRMALEPETG